MPGKVIKVVRRPRLRLAHRIYLPAIVAGLRVTTGHLLRNLWGFLTARPQTFTRAWPEDRTPFPDAFRGHPVLVADASGGASCVACGLCVFACPTGCISVKPVETAPGQGEVTRTTPGVFDLDVSRCMFCGLCEESCPETAIVMSAEVELASETREGMVLHLEDLLRSESEVARRLAFLARSPVRA